MMAIVLLFSVANDGLFGLMKDIGFQAALQILMTSGS
jgi:hypothetical protein